MRTIQKQIYRFEELSEDAQERALNHLRENQEYMGGYDEYFLDDFTEEVKEKTGLAINKEGIVWSVGDRNDKFGITNKYLAWAIQNRYGQVLDVFTPNNVGVCLGHLGGGICGLNKTEKGQAEITFNNYDLEDDDSLEDFFKLEQQKKIAEEINDKIDLIIDLCEEHYNLLREDYFYQFSDEAIKENIEINEFEFDEDGRQV